MEPFPPVYQSRFKDARDALLYLLAVSSLEDIRPGELIKDFKANPSRYSAHEAGLYAFLAIYRPIASIADRIHDAVFEYHYLLGSSNVSTEYFREKQAEIRGLYLSVPGSAEQEPYKYVTFGIGQWFIILTFSLLGYPPNTRDVIIKVLSSDDIDRYQWEMLMTFGFPLCIPQDICDAVKKATHQRDEKREPYFFIPMRSTIPRADRCDVIGRILEVLLLTPYSTLTIPLDLFISKLHTYACTEGSKYSSSLGSTIDYYIEYLKETEEISRKQAEDYALRYGNTSARNPGQRLEESREARDIQILTRIRDEIRAIQQRGKLYSQVREELSIQPTQGVFPGGEEYRGARARQAGVMRVISAQDIQDIIRKWNTSTYEDQKWNDLIQVAGSSGILPFKDKQGALTLIAESVRDILLNIESPVSAGQQRFILQASMLFNTSPDVENIRRAASAWTQKITTDTDWKTIIQIMLSLGVVNIPDSPEGFAEYLKQYISQY